MPADISLPESLTICVDEEMIKLLTGFGSLCVQLALKEDIHLQSSG